MAQINLKNKNRARSIFAVSIFIFTFFISFLFVPKAEAANKTASVSGAWSNTATWGGAAAPVSGDNTTINAGVTVTVDGTKACGTLVLNNNAAGDAKIVFNNGTQLTPSGAITIGRGAGKTGSIDMSSGGTLVIVAAPTVTTLGTFTPGTGTINWNITGAASTLPAAFTTYNNLTITSTTRTVSLGVATTVNGDLLINSTSGGLSTSASNFALTIGGNFTNNAVFTAGTSVVNMNGASSQTISGTGTITFSTLKSNNAVGVSLGKAVTTTTLTIGDVTSNSIFDDGGFQLTSTGTLNLTSGTFKLGSSGTATTFPAFGTRNISAGTTVEYASGVAQTVSSTPSYSNLTFSGAGAKTTASGTVTVGQDWSVTGGTATLNTNNTNVTVTGNISGSGAITSGTGIISVGGTWSNNGTFTADSGTVTYSATAGGQTINNSLTYNNLTLSNSSNADTAGGNLTVNGTLTTTAGGTLDMTSAFTLGGTLSTITNGGTIKTSVPTTTSATPIPTGKTWGGTVNYASSSGAQTLMAGTYNNLTQSGSAGSTLSGNVIVGGTLTLGGGNLITNANNIYINSTGSVSRTSGFVIGNLRKFIATGATSKTFEIGDSTTSNYAPMSVNFGNVTVAGDLTMTTISGDDPNIGTSDFDASFTVNRYWVATNSGITFNNYSAVFNFNAGDIDAGANTANFAIGKYNSPNWTYPTVGTLTSTSSQITGATSFSDFQVGERKTLDHFAFSAISTQTAGTAFNVTITAQDSHNSTVTGYTGTVDLTTTAGTIAPTQSSAFSSGVRTESVTVTQSGSGKTITATDHGGTKTGTSAGFTVNPGALDHFTFGAISTQTAGTAFNVTMTAQDSNNNTVTGYAGTVDLTTTAGTIAPTQSSAFSSGTRTESVSVTLAGSGKTITATDHGGTKTGTSGTFTVNVGSTTQFILNSPGPITAGTRAAYTVTRKDSSGNLVTSGTDTAYLYSTSAGSNKAFYNVASGGIPITSINITAGNSVANFWYYDDLAGTFTITSSDNAAAPDGAVGISDGTNSLVVNPGSLDHFTFATVGTQTAGIAFNITVTAKDVYGNTVTGYTNTVDLTTTAGTIAPTQSSAFSSGVRTESVSVTLAGSGKTITATDHGGTKTGTSAGFTVNGGSLDHFTFTSISTQAAGTAFSVTITAQDVNNNTANGYVGTVDLTTTAGSITPSTSNSFTSGILTQSFTVTQSGSGKTITATDHGGTKTGTSNTFTVNPGSLDHFSFNSISTQAAGTAFSVTMTAQDSNNNTVTGYTGTVDLSTTAGSVAPTQSSAFSFGTRTESVTVTQSGSGKTITATEHGGTKTGTSNTFTVNPGTLDHFSFTTIPTQAAGTAFNVTMTAQDLNNNTVTGYAGTVDLSTTAGTIAPTQSSAFSSGTRTESVTVSQSGSGKTITATDHGGTKTGISNTFNVSGGALDHFTFDSISTQTAGTAFSVTVTAQDINNNTVTNYGGTVDLSTTAGSITPSPSNAFTSGVLTQSFTVTQSGSGKTITATDHGGTKTGTSAGFTVNPGALDHFTFGAISTQTAGTAFNVTMTAQDSNNNTVTGYAGTVDLATTAGTINPIISGSFTSGIRIQSVTVTQAGSNKTITATDHGGTKTGTSSTFIVNPGALDHFSFTTISDQSAGTAFNVTMTAQDLNNNTVTGYAGTVDLSTTAGTIAPTQSSAFSSGTRTESVSVTLAGSGKTITATDHGGTKTGTSNTFTVNVGATAQFILNSPGPITAGTRAAYTVTRKDSSGNLVTSGTNTVYLYTSSTGANKAFYRVVSGGTPITSGIDITAGNSAVNFWYYDDLVGNYTITGSDNSSSPDGGVGIADGTDLLSVTEGSLDHFTFAVISTQTAGIAFNISMTAKDAYENTVTGYTNTVDLSTTAGTIAPTQSSAFSSGTRTESVTVSQSGLSKTITATDHGGTKTGTSNTFAVTGGALDHFTFDTIGAQSAGTAFSVTITAQDSNNNTVISYNGTVDLSTTAGSITPSPSNAFTSGILTQSFTVTQSGSNKTITATDHGGTKTGTSNTFTVNPGALDHFIFGAISTQTAGTAFNVTMTAQDVNNNTVTGYTGTVDLSTTAGSISPTVSGSFISGTRTQSVTVTQSGSGKTITATDHGGTKTGTSSTFTVNPGSLDHFSFTTISDQTAGTAFNVTMTAQDANNNTVTDYAGTVDLSTTAGTITPTQSSAFSSGTRTESVTVTQSGSGKTITATDHGGTKTGTSNTFNVSGGALDHFTFDTITNKTAGIAFNIIITAQDANNNTVTDYTGTVDLTTTAGTIAPTQSSAFSSGTRTESVSVTLAGSGKTITATDHGGTKTGTSNTFTVNVGVTAQFILNSPGPITAGTRAAYTVTRKDSSGNLVASGTDTVYLYSSSSGANKAFYQVASGGTPITSGIDITAGNSAVNFWYYDELAGTFTITGSDNLSGPDGGIGISDGTDSLTINIGTLDHFSFTNISNQSAGIAFNITMTAKDAYENTVTDYSDTVDLTTTAGTINPVQSSVFVSGVRTESVTVSTVGSGKTITATDHGGTKTGTSNTFTVGGGVLDHFTFDTISTQTAGTAFPVTITAQDVNNNTVTDYTGTVDLSTTAGSITPTPSNAFTSGVLTQSFTVTQAGSGKTITATDHGGTKTGTSNTFTVGGGTLDHFTFDSISDQTAGTAFNITIIAQDVNNNTVTGYTGTVDLTTNAGTIAPTTSGSFTSGTRTQSVTVTQAGSGKTITATDHGGTKTGTSDAFAVTSGALDHFTFDAIGAQSAGTAFNITITAQDVNNNTVTGYTGTVDLSTTAGTITPTQSSAFSSGVRTESVTVSTVGSGKTITATDHGGTKTGTSNTFTVGGGVLDHFTFDTISTQTAGTAFPVTITAQDVNNNTVTDYTGTVDLSTTAGSITPTPSNAFTSGVLTQSFTVTQAGSGKTITATDHGGTKTGTSGTFTVNTGSTTQFILNDPGNTTAGTRLGYIVTRKDSSGNLVTSGTDTVYLYSTSSGANKKFYNASSGGTVIPSSVDITEGNSTAVFWYYDELAGTFDITASDNSSGPNGSTGITDATDSATFSPAATDVYTLSNPGDMTAATKLEYFVTRKDAFNNLVISGSERVYLYTSSTGPASFYDANTNGNFLTYVDISNGNSDASFWYYDEAIGDWTITASDHTPSLDGNVGIKDGTDNISVSAAPIVATKFIIINPTDGTVDNPITVTVKAVDDSNNIQTTYQDDVILHTTGSATGAGVVNITDGVGTIPISDVFNETVGLSLTNVPGITLDVSSTQDVIFSSGAVSKFIINDAGDINAGSRAGYTVTREDQFGNLVTSGLNTVYLYTTSSVGKFYNASSNGNIMLSVDITGGHSVADFWYYDTIPGIYTITVSDNATVGDGIIGIDDDVDSITVSAGPVTQFVLNNPGDMTAATRLEYTVTRKDQFGNPVTTGTDTVYLYSNSTGPKFFYDVATGGSSKTSMTIGSGNSSVNFWYYDEAVGTWDITASDNSSSPNGSTGIDDSTDSVTVTSIQIVATKFVIIAPASGTVGTPATVTVRAEDNFGSVQTTYQNDVTLNVFGAASGTGLVDIINGVGTADVNSSTATTIDLGLVDTQSTGLDTSSIASINFVSVGTIIVKPPSGHAASPSPRLGGSLSFNGRAFPNALVTIVSQVEGQPVPLKQEITASDTGDFRIQFTGLPSFSGSRLFYLSVTDKEGRVSLSNVFDVAQQSSDITDIFLAPTIQFLSSIKQGDQFNVSGYALPNGVVDVEIDGNILDSKPRAGQDGYYSTSVDTKNLSLGDHIVRVRQTDVSGQQSAFSSRKNFTVANLSTSQIKTDFNNDSIVNINDWSIFLSRWSSPDASIRILDDLNGDGVVDVSDFSIFIKTLTK